MPTLHVKRYPISRNKTNELISKAPGEKKKYKHAHMFRIFTAHHQERIITMPSNELIALSTSLDEPYVTKPKPLDLPLSLS